MMDGQIVEGSPWEPQDGDRKCQECLRANPVWVVEHAVWNQVMGGEGGILCPTCFMIKTNEVLSLAQPGAPEGLNSLWRIELQWPDAGTRQLYRLGHVEP